MTVMLAQARLTNADGSLASNRETLDSLVGADRAAELVGAPAAPLAPDVVLIAPPPASGLAPWVEKPLESGNGANAPLPKAAPESEGMVDATPTQAAPAADSSPRREESKPEPKPKPKQSGFPAFDNFSAQRRAEREEEE